MDEAKIVTATFTNITYNLKVIFEGTGSGSVDNVTAGDSFDGGSKTWSGYMSGDSVSLTATPTTGSSFSGWNASNCQVVVFMLMILALSHLRQITRN